MDAMSRDELESLAHKMMMLISDVSLALCFTGTDLSGLPEHARGLHDQWAAYRTLGVAGVRRDGEPSVPVPGPATSHEQQFVAFVAATLSRPGDVDLDVLRHDLAERLVADRYEVARLHYPTGPFHEPCDQGRYATADISNPQCGHRARTCHECGRAWPCATARLFDVHGWFDPDSIEECLPEGWKSVAEVARWIAEGLDGDAPPR